MGAERIYQTEQVIGIMAAMRCCMIPGLMLR